MKRSESSDPDSESSSRYPRNAARSSVSWREQAEREQQECRQHLRQDLFWSVYLFEEWAGRYLGHLPVAVRHHGRSGPG